jgi:hypothetical protein
MISPKTLRKGASNMDTNGVMSKNKFRHRRGPLRNWLLAGGLALGTAVTVAACGSSSSGTAAGSASNSTPAAAATISTKSVHGVGTVLVNGQARPCTC